MQKRIAAAVDGAVAEFSDENHFFRVLVRVRKYKALNSEDGQWNPSEFEIDFRATDGLRGEEARSITQVLQGAVELGWLWDISPQKVPLLNEDGAERLRQAGKETSAIKMCLRGNGE